MYYADRHKCHEHQEMTDKIKTFEKQIDVIHSDLKAIKYLLVIVVGSILGSGVVL